MPYGVVGGVVEHLKECKLLIVWEVMFAVIICYNIYPKHVLHSHLASSSGIRECDSISFLAQWSSLNLEKHA